MSTLVEARNEARRGAFARQMLIWDEIIYSDGLLGMLYSRLIESVAMQGWKIDAADESPEAQRQKTALEEFYHSVNGLQQSFGQLASAMFYGYAHLQYIEDSWGRRFEFIPQRYWVRPGELNQWQFNPQCYIGVDTGESVEEETLVVMEHRYPILFPAARASFERNHAKITWDNHMDRYGSAPVIITAPKDASAAVMDALERACEQLKSGASIVLPPDCKAEPLKASNINENYFLSRINMADKDQVRFVMAGTLTVLNESGSGTLAGSAHTDSWNAVVSAVCSKVAEAFNTAISPLILEDGEPLARLHITFDTVQTPLQKAEEIAALADGGVRPEKTEIEEKIGMSIEDSREPVPTAAAANRESGDSLIPPDAYEQLQQMIYAGLMKGFNDDQYQTNQ
ncbi:phage portal protein family protein [Akkermansia muciniphila]|uniref:phage portal protein family protein n=1 Tax=Akkermansia muciniphila TaxID=239935 RepID=UPI003CCF9D58